MRDVGDEIPPYLIHLLKLSDFVKQNECSGYLARLVFCRDGMELDLRIIHSQLAANRLAATESTTNHSIERGIAHVIQQGRARRDFRQREKFSKCFIS